jgi:hypothetical protein
VIVGERETLKSISKHFAQWNAGYSYEAYPERRAAMEAIVEKSIAKLNPKSAAESRLKVGERLLVPSRAELDQAFKGSPTTRPARRP